MAVGVKGFGGSGGGAKLQGLSALPPAAVAAKGIFQVVPGIFINYGRITEAVTEIENYNRITEAVTVTDNFERIT